MVPLILQFFIYQTLIIRVEPTNYVSQRTMSTYRLMAKYPLWMIWSQPRCSARMASRFSPSMLKCWSLLLSIVPPSFPWLTWVSMPSTISTHPWILRNQRLWMWTGSSVCSLQSSTYTMIDSAKIICFRTAFCTLNRSNSVPYIMLFGNLGEIVS